MKTLLISLLLLSACSTRHITPEDVYHHHGLYGEDDPHLQDLDEDVQDLIRHDVKLVEAGALPSYYTKDYVRSIRAEKEAKRQRQLEAQAQYNARVNREYQEWQMYRQPAWNQIHQASTEGVQSLINAIDTIKPKRRCRYDGRVICD